MIVMHMALLSFSQGALGRSFNDVIDIQMKDVYMVDYKTTFKNDSILLHCYYEGYIQTYTFDGKTKKATGELLMTESDELASYLSAVYNSYRIRETDNSWIYTYGGKVVETFVMMRDIDGVPYHLFFTIYK